MNANEVIERYVKAVALLLPRRQRNDVAFELRALLTEELQAKAMARPGGRGPDEAMATELVRAFGKPSDVAARYRPAVIVIDPADGHAFIRAAVIGLAIIWCLGLVDAFRRPIGSGWDVLSVFGQWWMGVVIPSMWWPGVLVVYFGIAAWAKNRRSRVSDWSPRASEKIQGGPALMVLGLFGVLAGLTLLIEPRWVLDIFWRGKAAPAAYEALTYTDTFRQRQAPWMFVMVALNIPLFIAVIVNGQWSPMLRRVETVLAVITCVVLAWIAFDGPVFGVKSADQTMKFCLILIILYTVISLGIKLRRIVKPTPTMPVPSAR